MDNNERVNEPGRRWFVVQTKRGQERLAIRNLERQGIEVYCPMVQSVSRHRAGPVSTLAPFFPSYLFVRLDLGQPGWRTINATLGVSHLLTNSGIPAPLPLGMVECFIARTRPDGLLEFSDALDQSDSVRIVGGPLHDLVGTLVSSGPSARVWILLETLGGPMKVKVARGQIIAA